MHIFGRRQGFSALAAKLGIWRVIKLAGWTLDFQCFFSLFVLLMSLYITPKELTCNFHASRDKVSHLRPVRKFVHYSRHPLLFLYKNLTQQ
jgi:hypothetical protein